MRLDQFSKDNFVEWMRNLPFISKHMKVEAGFNSFSTLLIVTIPLSLSAYLPWDPAIISLGPVTTSNWFLQVSNSSTLLKDPHRENMADAVWNRISGARDLRQ
jgi:hypothetical protein